MFNGIIRYLGVILQIYGNKFLISSVFKCLNIGDSVACNGVCLTVYSIVADGFYVYLSEETLSKTNFCFANVGDHVNLEKSLRLGDNIDGHFVSGHVDTTSKIISISDINESRIFRFFMPYEYSRFITNKGSITVNGVSLTVNEVGNDYFEINIIPHTFFHTNFQYLKIDSFVNLEIDLFARYIDKIIKFHIGIRN